MISTTWDSNGHHVIREKINHLILLFLNTDVSRQKHWRHSRRVEVTNDLQLSRRVRVTPFYRQSLHEDIRFSSYWSSIMFPSYHENVSFCTHLFRLVKNTHVMMLEVITTREKVNVWSSHDWDMSDDLLICQGCFRAGQRCVTESSTRIVTTRKMSRENSDPWHILSRYDDHSTSINNWSREHLCKIWVYQAYISLFKETHVEIKKDLKVYEQLEKKKKPWQDQKRIDTSRSISCYIWKNVQRAESVLFGNDSSLTDIPKNRRHKPTEERLMNTSTSKNRYRHWSLLSTETHIKLFQCVQEERPTKKCTYETYRIRQPQSPN